MKQRVTRSFPVLLLILTLGGFGPYFVGTAQAADPKAGDWTGGAAIGFLGNTPDATAFAANFNADVFLTSEVSIGPLLQLGATGDLTQIGLSGQAKYWVELSKIDKRAKLTLQAGIGFLHADLHESDTSWLIPLGVGLDYALTQRVGLTATFLLNFTDIHTGRGTDAHVMPGLTFGIRF